MFVRHAVRSAARSGAASFSSKTIQQASRAAARTALAPSRQTGTPLRSSVFATAEATGLNGSFSTNAARRSTFASLETQSARMTLGQALGSKLPTIVSIASHGPAGLLEDLDAEKDEDDECEFTRLIKSDKYVAQTMWFSGHG